MAENNVTVPGRSELLDPINESGLVGELLGTCEHIVGGIINEYPNDGESMHDLLSLLAVIEKCITIQERSEAGFDQALSKMRASGAVASEGAKRKPDTGLIPEEKYNELEIIFEQITGCADLMMSHLPRFLGGRPIDNETMTALNVIKEKAASADSITRGWYKIPGLIQPETFGGEEESS